MEVKLKNGEVIHVRPYEEQDFSHIHRLNEKEGWKGLAERHEDTKAGWMNSNASFIAEKEGRVIGCLRGMTDGFITLFICELLVDADFRGWGIGSALLQYAHSLYPETRMELLASSTSKSFYEKERFRPFYGFRKTIGE